MLPDWCFQIMQQQDLVNLLEFTGKDPTRLVFEDELTSVYNRRFLFQYFQANVSWEKLSKDPLSLIMIDVDNFRTEDKDNLLNQIYDIFLSCPPCMNCSKISQFDSDVILNDSIAQSLHKVIVTVGFFHQRVQY